MEQIFSVGIDIGTTTTQVIFSRITLENMASFASVPRISIIDKEVIYESKIYFTPLVSHNEIDYNGIKNIVEREYAAASIDKKDLATGAVIITGESSRKDNAQTVLELLSGFAGNFVVATAGPDLEAALAAKGAGVHSISEELGKITANFDIGGGTTNVAVFQNGHIIDTTCLDIGGRLIRFDGNKVSYIADNIRWLAQKKGINISVGDERNDGAIEDICSAMAELLTDTATSQMPDEFKSHMFTRRVHADSTSTVSGLRTDYKIEAITFSGGVADYVYGDDCSDKYPFGDIGIMLARAIKKSELPKVFTIVRPKETIRATVVGAGMHSVEISGSTIEYNDDLLPLKNVPIIKINPAEEELIGGKFAKLSGALSAKLEWYRRPYGYETVAFAFKGPVNPSFQVIQAMCEGIINGIGDYAAAKPLIVILEHDMAKALGQTLRVSLSGSEDIVCIDGISVENGDYVDIGRPLSNGRVTPVVIKTLCL